MTPLEHIKELSGYRWVVSGGTTYYYYYYYYYTNNPEGLTSLPPPIAQTFIRGL